MPTSFHRWARANPIYSGFVIVILAALCIGWGEDVQSCRRTQTTRKAQHRNVGILQTLFMQDATRANAYAAIDSNKEGVEINRAYGVERAKLARSLAVPEIPDCFPIPGI